MAIHHVGKLGADVVDPFVGLALPSFPHVPPNHTAPPVKRRRAAQVKPALNGIPAVRPDS
jgi:hypothetical protein